MSRNKQIGFTLIELMIVVVVMAILLAIALPSYRNTVLKSHRADGKIGLSQCAVNQERWFTKDNVYNPAACTGNSPEAYYTLVVTIGDLQNDGECLTTGTPANNDCFTITAAPTSKDSQTEDTDCTTMTLNSMNVKTAVDGGGADTQAECWF